MRIAKPAKPKTMRYMCVRKTHVGGRLYREGQIVTVRKPVTHPNFARIPDEGMQALHFSGNSGGMYLPSKYKSNGSTQQLAIEFFLPKIVLGSEIEAQRKYRDQRARVIEVRTGG